MSTERGDLLTWVPRPVATEAVDLLRTVGEVALGYGESARSYERVADRVTGVLLRTERFGRHRIEAAPRLRVIARHGVGLDTVDVEAADQRGVLVTTTGDANTQSVAEHVFALLLAVCRSVVPADAAVRAGRWRDARQDLVGVELAGRRLGLLGCGRIGGRVARIGRAFGMDVGVCDPGLAAASAADLGVRVLDREELLAASDVLSLHLPLTEQTRHIVDDSTLASLPPGAILVNTSRGELVCEQALLRQLHAGRLLGAGLDVAENEPLPAAHPLAARPDVVLSPHVGGQTHEAMHRVALDAARSILAVYANLPRSPRGREG